MDRSTKGEPTDPATRPLRLFCDARVVRPGQTGVGVFSGSLACAMAAAGGAHVDVLTLHPDAWRGAPAGVRAVATGVDHESHPRGDLHMHFVLPRVAADRMADLYWGCAFSVPWGGMRMPRIVTIHDATVFTHRECYPRGFAAYLRLVIRRSARAAQAVHVPSEAVRGQLSELLPDVADRIFVVHGAASSWFRPERGGLPPVVAAAGRPFILAPGEGNPRKDTSTLLDAWRAASPRGKLLVLAGGVGPRMTEASDDGILRLGRVSDEEMRALYGAADLFVFPTLWEGFGLPVLEAMACGCPVAAPRVGALPEVGGDQVRWIDPYGPDALVALLREIAEAPNGRTEPDRAALAHAAAFSWGKSAVEFLKVARQVVERFAHES